MPTTPPNPQQSQANTFNMNISEEYYFSEGKHRSIYVHPDNESLCIKIPKVRLTKRSIKREIKYLKKYQKRASHFLSMFHSTVETNRGKGYVFQLIRDENGAISMPLSECKNLVGLKEKIHALYWECINKNVIVSDLHTKNIVVQKNQDSSYQLWIIDGAGNSDYIKICDIFKYFAKKKTTRKFSRLSKNLGLTLNANKLCASGIPPHPL